MEWDILKNAREGAGLTMRQLAADAGSSPAKISEWETKGPPAQIEGFIRVCKALGVSPNYLLGWREGPEDREFDLREGSVVESHAMGDGPVLSACEWQKVLATIAGVTASLKIKIVSSKGRIAQSQVDEINSLVDLIEKIESQGVSLEEEEEES